MSPAQILFPMAALVALTFVVLLLVPYARFKAARGRLVTVDDFKFGESGRVPGNVHRLTAYAASNFVLLAIWIRLFVTLVK